MSSKHAGLDRKLFKWIRETATGFTVRGAIDVLQLHGKAERRHINRRFLQMRARKLIVLVSSSPVQTFDTCATIPFDTTKPGWKACPSPSLKTRPVIQEVPVASSIIASTSEEYEASGGRIERLPTQWNSDCKGGRPTGYGFTFDE